MKNIIIALSIGAAAGLLDVLPMLKQKVPRFSILAIFVQWVFLGLIIPFLAWGTDPWLTGLIVAEAGMLPFMIQALYRNKKAVLPMFIFAGILGIAIGVAGEYFIQPDIFLKIKFPN